MNVVPAGLADLLRERWSARFPAMARVGDDLVSRYAHPTRVYHDVRHLFDVLAGVDILADEGADVDAVELGAWFHDAVYDVRRADNEAASAELARSALAPYLAEPVVAEVVRLVLVTRDHAVAPGDRNGAVLCDADLAILASTLDRYDDYAARVRTEYAHVPDDEFRAGRAQVLRDLQALPTLFHTAHGVREWEAKARANLQRELATLRGLEPDDGSARTI